MSSAREPEPGSDRSEPTRRRAVTAAGAYAFATGLQRALAFLLVPFFTRVVSPAEYGQLNIALGVAAVTTLLFTGGLSIAIFREYFQLADDPVRRERYVQTLWTTLLVVPLALAVVVTAISIPLLSGSDVLQPVNLGLALAAAALTAGGTLVPFAVLRARQRIREFLIITVTSALTTVGGTVLLVIVFDLGITAWLAALVASNAITLLLAMRITPFRGFAFDRKMLSGALRFTMPLVPHYVSQWALRVADQLVLATMVTIASVGVYSLAASIAAPALVLVVGVTQGFQPSYGAAGKFDEHREALPNLISLQFSIVALITLAAAALGPITIGLLASSSYHEAVGLAPWLILGYGLLGAYTIPMSITTLVHGRPGGVALVTVLSAAVNIAGVLLLVPPLGLTGAAIATPIGYTVQLVGLFIYARVVGATVPIPWPKVLVSIAICSLAFLGAELTTDSLTIADLFIRAGWVLLAMLALAGTSREFRSRANSLLRLPSTRAVSVGAPDQ